MAFLASARVLAFFGRPKAMRLSSAFASFLGPRLALAYRAQVDDLGHELPRQSTLGASMVSGRTTRSNSSSVT